MNKRYKTELLGVLHEMSVDLHKIGIINDEEMQKDDRDCLIQRPKVVRKSRKTTVPRENPSPQCV